MKFFQRGLKSFTKSCSRAGTQFDQYLNEAQLAITKFGRLLCGALEPDRETEKAQAIRKNNADVVTITWLIDPSSYN